MPKFRNLDDRPRHRGVGCALRWKLGLAEQPPRASARGFVMPHLDNDGSALQGGGPPSLTWIGHATFLVQLGGRSILTDPILSPRITLLSRLPPLGLSWENLPKIDLVTVSHNHRDHMDAPTLLRLGPQVTYVVPEGLGDWFRRAGLPRVIELAWWERRTILDIDITMVPAQHWSRRGLLDEDESHWGGFVLASGGRSVYHSGDTAYFSGFRLIGERVGPIDVAMLPIGAYQPRWLMKDFHMDPDDAVQAFCDLEARRFCAMHWGTFQLSDEPLDEPPRLLQEIWGGRGLPIDKLSIPKIGETLLL